MVQPAPEVLAVVGVAEPETRLLVGMPRVRPAGLAEPLMEEMVPTAALTTVRAPPGMCEVVVAAGHTAEVFGKVHVPEEVEQEAK